MTNFENKIIKSIPMWLKTLTFINIFIQIKLKLDLVDLLKSRMFGGQ